MAEEKIQFSLGAVFTGKPAFDEQDRALKGLQKDNKGAVDFTSNTLKGLAGTIEGELNGTITRSISLLSDLARGGLWGVMGAAAQIGVGMAITAMQSLASKAAEAHEEVINLLNHVNDFHESLNRIADGKAITRMKDSLKEATIGAKEAMQAIEAAASSVNAIASAKSSSSAAAVQEQIANIVREKAQQVAASLDEFDKSVIAAKADIKIASIELAEAERAAPQSVEAAARDVETAQAKQMQAIDNLVAAQRAVEIAENDYKKAKVHGAVKQQEYEATLERARAAEKDAMAAKARADTDLSVALEKQSEAESKKAAAVARAEAKVVELTAKRDEIVRKHNESLRAEELLTGSTNELADKRNEFAVELKKQKDAIKADSDAQHNMRTAWIRAAEKEIEDINQLRKDLDEGELAYLKHHEWMGKPLSRNPDGGINSFKDYMKAKRWKDRADRDKDSMYEKGNDARLADIEDRIAKGKKVSDRDKEWAENWRGYKKQKGGTESLEKSIRAWKDEQLEIAETSKKALEDIDDRLKTVLGLK